MNYYLIYNDKIGEYLRNPQSGYWSTTDRSEAEGMLKIAIDYVKERGFIFLEGKLRIIKVDSKFNPETDPVPQYGKSSS